MQYEVQMAKHISNLQIDIFCHFNFCNNKINLFWYITSPLGHQHYWKIQIVYLALVLRKFRRNSVSTMPNHSLRWVNYRVSRSWGDHYTQLLAFEKSCPVTIFEYCFKWRIFRIPSVTSVRKSNGITVHTKLKINFNWFFWVSLYLERQ